MKNSNRFYIYFIGLVAGLAGLLFGFDTGVISGAIGFIKNQFELTDFMEGLVVSSVMCGAVFGTFVSNYISRNFGRHIALIVSGILFTLCSLGSAFSPTAEILIVARFCLGLAVGLASYTAPLYLAEISPRDIRGRIISFYQLMIAAGLLLSYVSDLLFTDTGNWRFMLGIPAIPGIVLLVFALILPGSPRWLILKNRISEARSVLEKILPISHVEQELNEISTQIKLDSYGFHGVHALKDRRFIGVLALGLIAQMMQQWTGCNIVLYYAPIIFKLAGFVSPKAQMWGTIAVGAVMMFTTAIAVKYVDKYGRRPILFWGLVLMSVSLLSLGFALQIAQSMHMAQIIAVVAVLSYIFGFAISLGPIVWIICSEIFPIHTRDFGVMTTTAGNWIFNALLAFIFPSMITLLGSSVFFIFLAICLSSIVFIYFYMPETKGISLEQIEANVMAGNNIRNIGI